MHRTHEVDGACLVQSCSFRAFRGQERQQVTQGSVTLGDRTNLLYVLTRSECVCCLQQTCRLRSAVTRRSCWSTSAAGSSKLQQGGCGLKVTWTHHLWAESDIMQGVPSLSGASSIQRHDLNTRQVTTNDTCTRTIALTHNHTGWQTISQQPPSRQQQERLQVAHLACVATARQQLM